MTDYLTQCNAIAAEKKVWRWAKYDGTTPCGTMRSTYLYREDHEDFTDAVYIDEARTEYLGDEDGNPIPPLLGPQELWDRHRIVISRSADAWIARQLNDSGGTKWYSYHATYDAALAEANRIAGGA